MNCVILQNLVSLFLNILFQACNPTSLIPRGILTSLAIYLADWSKVVKVVKDNNIGHYNALPNTMNFIKSFAWALYGLVVKDYFIFFSCLVGMNICMYYCLSIYHLTTFKTQKTICLMLLVSQSVLLITAAISLFVIVPFDPDRSLAKRISGSTGIVTLLLYFIVPLLKIKQVIQLRDASSISSSLAITTGLSCIVWGSYGFALNDKFIFISNIFGIFTVILQIGVVMFYKQHKNVSNVNLQDYYFSNK